MNSLPVALAFGMPEMMMVLAILLLLFGGSKLPSLAKGLGQSVKEFKKATKEGSDDDDAPTAPASLAAKSSESVKTGRPGSN